MTELRSVTAAPFDATPNAPHNSDTAPGWQARLRTEPTTLRVHILGIGGTGVGPIARVLLQMGVQVSGSDRQMNAATQALAASGATVYPTQSAANLLDLPPHTRPHLVLISSAVAAGNPERQAAAQLGVPIVKRSDFLPELLAQRTVIAISGSHGKTTTTGMIAHILHHTGIGPGYIIGADVPGLGAAAAGTSPWFVIEADEYDHMFLGLFPTVAVVTNVEWDHPDCFPTATAFTDAFRSFLAQVQRDGHIISCHDDAGAEALRHSLGREDITWLTYGLDQQAGLQLVPAPEGESTSAPEVQMDGKSLGSLRLSIPGLHNQRNALAALAAAHHCGVPWVSALDALATYRGSGRRFELIGEAAGVTIIDDYGHHPTEVAATLAAARSRFPDRVIHAVFQPHTFSRTRLLCAEMAASMHHADHALVTDIYPAREQDDGSIHAQAIVDASHHPSMVYTGNLDQTAQRLIDTVQPGHVVITLSAGDGNRIGRDLLAHLRAQSATGEAQP